MEGTNKIKKGRERLRPGSERYADNKRRNTIHRGAQPHTIQ